VSETLKSRSNNVIERESKDQDKTRQVHGVFIWFLRLFRSFIHAVRFHRICLEVRHGVFGLDSPSVSSAIRLEFIFLGFGGKKTRF
jgi:hypothetical protein